MPNAQGNTVDKNAAQTALNKKQSFSTMPWMNAAPTTGRIPTLSQPAAPQTQGPKQQFATGNFFTGNPASTASQPQKPTAPAIKKETVTEYHAPANSQQISTGAVPPQPKTGNVQTPSGATVNSSTGGLVSGGPQQSFQQGLVADLIRNAQGNGPTNPAVQESSNALAGIRKNIGELRGQLGTNQNAYLSGGLTSPVAMGRSQVLAQTEAQQEEGLGQQALAEQQRLSNVLQGQQQGTNAISTALSASQPQLAGFNQQAFNPLTGQFSGGADVNSMASSIAQQVLSGRKTYDQARSELSAFGVAGDNALRQALGPSFNVNTSNALAGIQGQQTEQVQNLTSALQQGQNLQSQLTDLITAFGLNPNDVNAVNQGLQQIAANVSDPRYQLLNNYINDIANTYAQVLTPAGGAQTDTTRAIATSMLDATAKGQSIIAVMHGLDEAAKAKIAGVQTVGKAPQSSAFTGDAWK